MPDAAPWFRPALLCVAAVTAARLVALGFNRTDLFVDESQYWLWGQSLDFGYYSKPPLIAWVIRLSTEALSSDGQFAVRAPAALFHAATALVLAALAARLAGGRAAIWVAASYVTLPFVALGSLLISTDTIMAPFFAAALYFFQRLSATGRARFAVAAGVAAGLAFLAKYAAVYFLLGAALSAAFVPALRIGWRNAAWLGLAFLLTALPNLLWNLGHQLATLEHTLDNIGWVRGASEGPGLHPERLAGFFLSQFAVFGPVLFAALLWFVVQRREGQGRAGQGRWLLWFALPAIGIVLVQALLSKAYANWAVSAYFAATVFVVPLLLARAPRLLTLSLVLNAAISLALPVLTMVAPWPTLGGTPLLGRYLGRAELSAQILGAAREAGAATVLASNRDILADLFHARSPDDPAIHAPVPEGRPENYFQQTYPLPADADRVLFVGNRPPACALATPLATFDTSGGAYAGKSVSAWLLPEGCFDHAE